jgi:type IV secretory pathway VirB4 component
MELNFNEIASLQNAEVLKQKIQEVMTVLQEKGFEAKIKSHGVWDMLYIDNMLRFNLYVSIPVHDK